MSTALQKNARCSLESKIAMLNASLKFFFPIHAAVTALLFLLQFIRRKESRWDENVLLPPQHLYPLCSVYAVIMIFPFIPYYFGREWVEAYYVLMPTAACANIIRLLLLNWRVEVGEETAVTRDMLGIKKEFILKESELKKSIFKSHTLSDGKKRFNISDDTPNFGYLVQNIDKAKNN